MLGAKDAYNMKKGKIYLFLTPCFLHANFIHIFSNILSTLMFGMNFESAIGVIRFLLIYFMSGIGGNLFSALINDMPAVGASTSIMGIFGAHVAFIILNWFSLRVLGFIRWQMLFLMM